VEAWVLIMDDERVEDGKNKKDLFCTICPSKILLPRVGTYAKCENVSSFLINLCSTNPKPNCFLFPIKNLPKMTQKKGAEEVETDLITECFQVKDPFDFENVGFSKVVGNFKYLTCSDCELGPIGWQIIPDSLCYIAPSRVRHGLDPIIPSSIDVDENAN